jgi:hypothetical protein
LSAWLAGGGFGSVIAPRGHSHGHSRAQPLAGTKSRQRACQGETPHFCLDCLFGCSSSPSRSLYPLPYRPSGPEPWAPSPGPHSHDGALRGVRLGCNAGPAGGGERLAHLRPNEPSAVHSTLRPRTANGLGNGSMLTRWRRGTGGMTQALAFRTCDGTRAPGATRWEFTSRSGHVDPARDISRPRGRGV